MRIAVVGDIHGNVLALEAVLADVVKRKVDGFINLGDCVSGPLWPQETAVQLMELGWPTVRGNHDRWVAEVAPDEQFPSDAFARQSLNAEQLSWLAELPTKITVAPGIIAFHGRPDDDNAYFLEDIVHGQLSLSSSGLIAERIAAENAQVIFCAHSHLPRLVTINGMTIINPGSVGLPAYEDPSFPAHVSETGSPHARYAIVDADGANVKVEFMAMPYDHIAAAKRAEQNGSSSWAHFLRTGFARQRFHCTDAIKSRSPV